MPRSRFGVQERRGVNPAMGGFPESCMRIACEDRRLEWFPVAGDIEVALVEDQLVGAADRLFRDEHARRTLCAGGGVEEGDDAFQCRESGRVQIRHAVDYFGWVCQS